ncbi:MAG: DUF1569 domain-containing protein [Reichenbachiella sp.]
MKLKISLGILIGIITILTILVSNSSNTINQDFLKGQLQEVIDKTEKKDQINEDVSQVPVSWHLYHLLKAANGMYAQLDLSDPSSYAAEFNMLRIVVFTTGIIPRGAGKAPDSSKPPENVTTQDILDQVDLLQNNLSTIDQLDENTYYTHNTFGNLNRQMVKRLIEIHTNHHLKITRDILGE